MVRLVTWDAIEPIMTSLSSVWQNFCAGAHRNIQYTYTAVFHQTAPKRNAWKITSRLSCIFPKGIKHLWTKQWIKLECSITCLAFLDKFLYINIKTSSDCRNALDSYWRKTTLQGNYELCHFLYSWSRLLLISILAVKMVMHDIENPLKTLFELLAICGRT